MKSTKLKVPASCFSCGQATYRMVGSCIVCEECEKAITAPCELLKGAPWEELHGVYSWKMGTEFPQVAS